MKRVRLFGVGHRDCGSLADWPGSQNDDPILGGQSEKDLDIGSIVGPDSNWDERGFRPTHETKHSLSVTRLPEQSGRRDSECSRRTNLQGDSDSPEHSPTKHPIRVLEMHLGSHHPRLRIFGCGQARDFHFVGAAGLEYDSGQRIHLDHRRVAAIDEGDIAFGNLNHDAHEVGAFDSQNRHALAFRIARVG
jgi:hypothetical protein